jgi:hypothetical protein
MLECLALLVASHSQEPMRLPVTDAVRIFSGHGYQDLIVQCGPDRLDLKWVNGDGKIVLAKRLTSGSYVVGTNIGGDVAIQLSRAYPKSEKPDFYVYDPFVVRTSGPLIGFGILPNLWVANDKTGSKTDLTIGYYDRYEFLQDGRIVVLRQKSQMLEVWRDGKTQSTIRVKGGKISEDTLRFDASLATDGKNRVFLLVRDGDVPSSKAALTAVDMSSGITTTIATIPFPLPSGHESDPHRTSLAYFSGKIACIAGGVVHVVRADKSPELISH